MQDILRNNPLIQQQLQRLRRQGVVRILIGVFLWAAITWLVRSWLVGAVPLAWFGRFDILVMALYGIISFTFRADLFLCFLLGYTLMPTREWNDLREHLGTSLLTPMQIIAGRVVVPWLVLVVINLGAAPFLYQGLWTVGGLYGLSGWESTAIATQLLIMAITEDLLFAAICVFAMARYYVNPAKSKGTAMMASLWTLFLAGCAIGFISVLIMPMDMLMRSLEVPKFVYATTVNIVPMIAIGIFEVVLLRHLYKQTKRSLMEWLSGE